MAFYPKATRRLIYPENNLPHNGGASYLDTLSRRPTTFIYHSAVGRGSLYDYFNRSDIKLESHTWIGLDPEAGIEQYLDNNRKADANYKANGFAMSWETADNGHPDSFEWTPYQCAEIAESMVWGREVYNIPLIIPSAWDKPGMGYHTLFGAPSNWTPVAKSCPGRVRILQFPKILVAARKLYNLKHNPPKELEGMDADTPIELGPANKRFLEDRNVVVGSDNAIPFGQIIVLQTIATIRQQEAAELTNTKLNTLINLLTPGTP
jgi:hypothetical protein